MNKNGKPKKAYFKIKVIYSLLGETCFMRRARRSRLKRVSLKFLYGVIKNPGGGFLCIRPKTLDGGGCLPYNNKVYPNGICLEFVLKQSLRKPSALRAGQKRKKAVGFLRENKAFYRRLCSTFHRSWCLCASNATRSSMRRRFFKGQPRQVDKGADKAAQKPY